MTSPSNASYRHELDGLRAIAVLTVLGYHAGYNDFAGGFMGVDVFLVLSGYLIVQQIGAALDAGRFHAGRFWLRRARRLLPAMLPVLAFALVAALLLKGQGAFDDFAGHFLSAGLFFSNYQFLSEADYFARASDTNLLLHTWSLSLEWQFYLVTPPIIMAVHRFGRGVILATLVALSVGSLVLSESLIRGDQQSWAFYGVMPRYWEFAAGGIVALLPATLSRWPFTGPVLRALGLGLILWAIFGYQQGSFPGLGATMAVGGSALVLLAPKAPRDPVHWLLNRRWLQWVGLRSYPIYLVHWPLFVTVTPTDMSKSEGILSAALLVSLFLGHLIYRYVETPVRTGDRFRAPAMILRYGGAALAGIALVGLALPTAPIAAMRAALPLSEIRDTATELDVSRAEYLALLDRIHANEIGPIRFCTYDRIDSPDGMLGCLTAPDIPEDAILLIGDSHGRDAVAALSRAFPDQTFLMAHQSSCVPATYRRGQSDCFPGLTDTIASLARQGRLHRVILAARWWQGEHLNVEATLSALSEAGADVLIIGPGPTFDTPMDGFASEAAFSGTPLRARAGVGPDRFAFDVASVNGDMHAFADAAGAAYFDKFALFCPDGVCRIFDGPDGSFLFFDDQHLSFTGLDALAAALAANPAVRALVMNR